IPVDAGAQKRFVILEIKVFSKSEYDAFKYGNAAVWIWEAKKRNPSQRFDLDGLVYVSENAKESFSSLLSFLNNWIYVFLYQELPSGETVLQPVRMKQGAIVADFLAAQSKEDKQCIHSEQYRRFYKKPFSLQIARSYRPHGKDERDLGEALFNADIVRISTRYAEMTVPLMQHIMARARYFKTISFLQSEPRKADKKGNDLSPNVEEFFKEIGGTSFEAFLRYHTLTVAQANALLSNSVMRVRLDQRESVVPGEETINMKTVIFQSPSGQARESFVSLRIEIAQDRIGFMRDILEHISAFGAVIAQDRSTQKVVHIELVQVDPQDLDQLFSSLSDIQFQDFVAVEQVQYRPGHVSVLVLSEQKGFRYRALKLLILQRLSRLSVNFQEALSSQTTMDQTGWLFSYSVDIPLELGNAIIKESLENLLFEDLSFTPAEVAIEVTSSSLDIKRVFDEKLSAIYTTTKPVVVDISLEAFLPELDDRACRALGAGGLGFLTGETWGAYSELNNILAFGVMPLYDLDKQDQQIDWTSERNIHPVILENGNPLVINVVFNSMIYSASIFWVNRRGTLVFLIRCPEIFSRLYRGGDEQTRYYGFLARSFVELMKRLKIAPALTRLNEPQLVFVATAMENDRAWYRDNGNGHHSLFEKTKIVMTTHTPEAAALPYWNRGHICHVVGEDLVRWEIVLGGKYGNVVNAAIGLARLADVINGVAQEHAEVTKIAVLPEFKDKIVGIVNGSDPWLWACDDLRALLEQKGREDITGEDLFALRHAQKEPLNQYLEKNFGFSFSDPSKPLIGLIRRLVDYKEQGILIPNWQQEWDKFLHKKYAAWITGDRDRFYETPWDAEVPLKKGLAANLLVGGDTYYDNGAIWVSLFKEMAQDPELKGKFLFVEKSGIEIMKKVINATDVWVSMPRCTREACGTSDQRAALTGGYNIATATGGPLEYIIHGVNGWLMDPFAGWDLARVVRGFDFKDPWFVGEFQRQAAILLGRYLQEAMDRYYRYTEQGDRAWVQGLKDSMDIAYEKVSIHVMARKYELLFLSTLSGRGAEGFKQDMLNVGSSNISLAVRTLKNLFGITIDLQKQTVNGMTIKDFLFNHELFCDCAEAGEYKKQDEQNWYLTLLHDYNLARMSVAKAKKYILATA
ncbi:MAG TPA: hypothetical protein PLO93_03480, partial [Candidatus Omnitrophota bacterium]|nr:hypothetical protein [Candidatus Omnitrophota bacterium]